MGLDFNSIDNLVSALKLIVLSVLICATTVTLILIIILGKFRGLEFKVTPVKLKIYQLIDQLANNFAITRPQCLYLKIFDIGKPEFFKVSYHFRECILYFAFKVSEVNEYTLFFVLKTNK